MKIFRFASIVLASLILASGYAMDSLWIGALIVAVIGLVWLIGQSRAWSWTASLGLIFLIGMSAFGLWLELSSGLMLCGTVATLAAWDLDDFSMRLQRAKRVEGERQLVRSHLWRLLMVSALGLLLGGVALSIRVTLGFWWALLLGFVGILGLGRTIGLLRRESLVRWS